MQALGLRRKLWRAEAEVQPVPIGRILMATIIALLVLFLAGLFGRSLTTLITVWEYQRGVKFTKGKFVKVLEPGQHRYSPTWTQVRLVDLRQKFQTVEGQEVMSSDGVGLKVSLVVQYNVSDP